MAKHLNIKEKLNAKNELKEIALKIKELRKQIKLVIGFKSKEELRENLKQLMERRKKLQNHICYSKRSKYNGKFGINGTCYEMFGKKSCDLTKEERTQYNKVMKARQRMRTGTLYDKEYHKKYYSSHKEELREKRHIWSINNKDKIKEGILRRKLAREKERGYGPYEGTWTYKTFGKHYKDMTEEEKIMRRKIYNQIVRKEMMKSE